MGVVYPGRIVSARVFAGVLYSFENVALLGEEWVGSPPFFFARTPAKRIGQNRSRESELVHFQHGAKSAEE